MPKLKEAMPGIRIGAAIVRRNLTIFPLFSEQDLGMAGYVTIGIALRSGLARITETSEGGSVPTLALESLSDTPVLIIDGEELIGARQNRIANLSVLAPGKTVLPLPVSCVERGRWHYQSREFAESPDIMFNFARAKKARSVSLNMAMQGSRASDQSSVWEDIDRLSSDLGVDSATSSMQDVFENRRASIDEYVRDMEPRDGQVGAIFAINGRAAGIELFDSTETFRIYLPKILRSYGLDALANQTLLPVSTIDDEAERLLESILELDARAFQSIGLGEDLRLDSPTISGGALSWNGRLIHLAAFQTVLPHPSGRNRGDEATRPLVIRKGHMLVRGGHGRVAILDTGSPVSIGRGSEYSVAGQSWNPSSAMSGVLETAGEHLGRRVEWLLGHDFFAANRVLLDWRGGRMRVLSENDPQPAGESIPIELVMGVPVITGRSRRQRFRAVLDSGASLSYVPADVVKDLRPVGSRSDFYPGFGEFETDVWRVRAEVGGRTFTILAGVLPPMLQMMFGMLLGPDGWIIGSDFFRNRVILVDYAGSRVTDATDQHSNGR